MTNENRHPTPENDLDRPKIFRFVIKENDVKKERPSAIRSICFIARFTGAAAYFVPVTKMFAERGVSVYFIVANKAEDRIKTSFESTQLEPAHSLPHVDWAMISNDEPVTFEIEQLEKLKRLNLQLNIALGEDVPGGIEMMLPALLDNEKNVGALSLTPDIVFTTTGDQREEYLSLYPEISKDIITVGQPAFDFLKNLDTSERNTTRNRILELANSTNPNSRIVVFAGVPESDYPQIPIQHSDNTHPDLKSHALYKALTDLVAIAQQNPHEEYVFVYKPHPREEDDLKNHPYLEKCKKQMAAQGITNVHLVYQDEKVWRELSLNTNKLCIAANAVITTVSTLGQEIALTKIRRGINDLSLPVLILPSEYIAAYRKMEQDDPDSVKTSPEEILIGPELLHKSKAAILIDDPESSSSQLEHALMNVEDPSGQTAHDHKHLIDEYRSKSSMQAAERIYLWLSRAHKHKTQQAS